VKLGPAVTVRATVVEFTRLPEVPVIVRLAVPVAAVLVALSVTVLLEVAGFGLNGDAVIPAGKPEMLRVTFPANPFTGLTVTLVGVLAP
jgi:hypothetical protein